MSAVVVLSLSASAQDLDCDGGSHRDAMVCQKKRLKALDDELNKVYERALAAMPEKDGQDERKGREQLRKSQLAWFRYVGEQCDLEGGLQGGSDSWISTFAAQCWEKEFNSRISFLRSIASHAFGA